MFGKIKIRPADKLFRQYLIKERGEKCEKCGRSPVQVSHFYGRRSESTRYDPQNVDLLCFTCHRLFHESPASYSLWKLQRLGNKEWVKLAVRSATYKKRDDKMREIELRALLANLKDL